MAEEVPAPLECVIPYAGGDAVKNKAKLALFVLGAVAGAEGARQIVVNELTVR